MGGTKDENCIDKQPSPRYTNQVAFARGHIVADVLELVDWLA